MKLEFTNARCTLCSLLLIIFASCQTLEKSIIIKKARIDESGKFYISIVNNSNKDVYYKGIDENKPLVKFYGYGDGAYCEGAYDCGTNAKLFKLASGKTTNFIFTIAPLVRGQKLSNVNYIDLEFPVFQKGDYRKPFLNIMFKNIALELNNL